MSSFGAGGKPFSLDGVRGTEISFKYLWLGVIGELLPGFSERVIFWIIVLGSAWTVSYWFKLLDLFVDPVDFEGAPVDFITDPVTPVGLYVDDLTSVTFGFIIASVIFDSIDLHFDEALVNLISGGVNFDSFDFSSDPADSCFDPADIDSNPAVDLGSDPGDCSSDPGDCSSDSGDCSSDLGLDEDIFDSDTENKIFEAAALDLVMTGVCTLQSIFLFWVFKPFDCNGDFENWAVALIFGCSEKELGDLRVAWLEEDRNVWDLFLPAINSSSELTSVDGRWVEL